MPLGTTSPNLTGTRPSLGPGGSGRPPLDRPRGGGGGGGGHGGDGIPDYSERLRRYRLGLAIALVSVVTLFVCMGAAFLFREGFSSYDPSTGMYVRDWTPLHLPLRVLWFDTIVLMASSLTLELARRQAVRRAAIAPALRIPGVADDGPGLPWLQLTVVLGFTFLGGQVVAWQIVQRGLMRPNGISDSFFYILTGTHAFHVLVGVFALTYAVSLKLRSKPDEHRRVVIDVVSWYWHVIGVLWIYLFALLALSA